LVSEDLAGLEVVVDVLLGGDGNAVTGGGAEVPGFERQQDFLIYSRRHAVQDALINDVAGFVAGDLDDDVTLFAELPRVNGRIRSVDGEGGTDLLAREWSVGKRTELRAGGRS
jgi:hypothetical protein